MTVLNLDVLNLDRSSLPQFLASKCEDILEFCLNFLSFNTNSLHLRKDYREFICLAVIFLGGSFQSEFHFSFLAPGAVSHARWMAKIIYTIKIALFSSYFVQNNLISHEQVTQIRQLALFLIVYHLKPWFTCTDPTIAPYSDLVLYKNLITDINRLSSQSSDLAQNLKIFLTAYLRKLDNHL